MSTVGYDNAGEANQPSPIIWKDCPLSNLNDFGTGYFAHEDFLGPPTGTLAASLDVTLRSFGGNLAVDADTDTVLSAKAGEEGGWLDVETDGDDNDAVALYTEPLGPITKNSGKKLWLESYVELGDTDADQGFFFGVVEEAGASRDVLADDVAAQGVIGESLIGFLVDNGDDDAVDIVYRKDSDSVVEVASDVTNSTQIASGNRASLADDTPVKLGMRFDGIETIRFYVNGVQVATQTVDSTIDQSKAMCGIMALKTGAAAAESFATDWIRYGYEARV
jgi:hypothetical protein